MLRLCNSLTSKPVPVPDLKDQLIFSFCDLEDDIEPCTNVNDVMKVLRRSSYCSFSNCFIVQDLAQQFSLHDVEEDLREYLMERSEYYRTIMLEDFVQEAQESIGRNRKVYAIMQSCNYSRTLTILKSCHNYIGYSIMFLYYE